MPFLMNIAFDNTLRLERRTYYFEYKGIRFKLVQNDPSLYHDHLLTIVPSYNSTAERKRVFAAASEFVSALAWQNDADMTVWDSGGAGWRDHRPLRSAKPTIYGFPRIPFRGHHIGGTLVSIPHVETDEQRIALSLFREARASNNRYLSFLFFWQSMEVKASSRPQEFIEDVMKNRRQQVPLEDSWFDRLPLDGRPLGQYLKDDCRNSVAHIKRFAGGKVLNLDSWEDQLLFAVSVRVVEALAEAYIRHHLGMSSTLTLVRPRSGGFPRFVEPGGGAWRFKIAYPPKMTRLRTGPLRPPRRSHRYY